MQTGNTHSSRVTFLRKKKYYGDKERKKKNFLKRTKGEKKWFARLAPKKQEKRTRSARRHKRGNWLGRGSHIKLTTALKSSNEQLLGKIKVTKIAKNWKPWNRPIILVQSFPTFAQPWNHLGILKPMKAWIPTSIILTQLLWGETWTGKSVTFPQEIQMCSSLGRTMLAMNQTAMSWSMSKPIQLQDSRLYHVLGIRICGQCEGTSGYDHSRQNR